MELRISVCDTVFFLDYPTEVCLDGVKERHGKPRSDMPWVEPVDDVDVEFIEFVKNYISMLKYVSLEPSPLRGGLFLRKMGI